MLRAVIMEGMVRFALVTLPLLAFEPASGAREPKLPADAPYCVAAGARQVFVAPMGAVFRAPSGQPYPSSAWFAAADRNHDGAVDRDEFVADASLFFRQLDLDHDGRLDPAEVGAYEQDVAPEIALFAGRREPQRRRRGRGSPIAGVGEALGIGSGEHQPYGDPLGAGRYAWLNIPEPVASADTDIDRLVSADEFAVTAARRFDTLDAGAAGRLRLADLPRTPQQAAIAGPCRPLPKPRQAEHHGPFDDPPDGGEVPR